MLYFPCTVQNKIPKHLLTIFLLALVNLEFIVFFKESKAKKCFFFSVKVSDWKLREVQTEASVSSV